MLAFTMGIDRRSVHPVTLTRSTRPGLCQTLFLKLAPAHCGALARMPDSPLFDCTNVEPTRGLTICQLGDSIEAILRLESFSTLYRPCESGYQILLYSTVFLFYVLEFEHV